MINPIVVIIAGPPGTGKTTIAKRLSRHFDCAHISEDEITKDIFPGEYKDVEDYPDKLKMVENYLFKIIKENFNCEKTVIVDRINLDEAFINEVKKLFHKHLILKVLWPSIETTIERDKSRRCWTSGEITIKRFYKKYQELMPIIGNENYIYSSHHTPKETLEIFISNIDKFKAK